MSNKIVQFPVPKMNIIEAVNHYIDIEGMNELEAVSFVMAQLTVDHGDKMSIDELGMMWLVLFNQFLEDIVGE